MDKLIKIAYILFFWLFFLLVTFFSVVGVILFIRMWQRLLTHKNKKIRILDSMYPENAGSRQRAIKWAEKFTSYGYTVKTSYVYDRNTFYQRLEDPNNIIRFQCYFLVKRFADIFTSLSSGTVIVRRSLLLFNDYGGGVFMDRLLLNLHGNCILDFDDDLLFRGSPDKTLFGKILAENHNKFYKTLRVYKKFVAGSNYLKALVLEKNPRINSKNIIVIPTCVDYDKYERKLYKEEKELVFGWIGTNGNQVYLDLVIGALNQLHISTPLKLIVISGAKYTNEKARFRIENITWSADTEVGDLKKIDVGIMPLFDGPVEKGKCGYKLIQYMGLGIVSVASAITVNKEIVDDGVNGFLVYHETEWLAVLQKAIARRNDFPTIGMEARQKVLLNYSFSEELTQKYLAFIENDVVA